MRGKTEGALKLNLNVDIEGEENLSSGSSITFPSSVEFADGSATADIVINYVVKDKDYDKFVDVEMSLTEDAEPTPYGQSIVSFKIGVPAPWEPVDGAENATMATYMDDVMTAVFTGGIEPVAYKVEIQQNAANKSMYRLVNPYGKNYPYNESLVASGFPYDESKDYYLNFSIENPDKVVLEGETGFTIPSNGTLGVATLQGGEGQYKDGIITFPEQGLAYTFNGELWSYVNKNGKLKISMPGIDLSDFSIESSFEGIHKGNDSSIAGVIASVNKIGADVKLIGFAVEKGDFVLVNEEDTASLIKNIGENRYSTSEVEYPKSYIVPFTPKESGLYSLLTVVLDGDKIKNVSKILFKADAESWLPVYKVNYSTMIFQNDEKDLVVSQSSLNPDKFKITGSKYYKDFVFQTIEYEGNTMLIPLNIVSADPTIAFDINESLGQLMGNKYAFNLTYIKGNKENTSLSESFVIIEAINDSEAVESVSFNIEKQTEKKLMFSNKSLEMISGEVIVPLK